jgi:hypothetical protein
MQLRHFEQIDTALGALLRAEDTPAEARLESRLYGALVDALGFQWCEQHVSRAADTAAEIVTAGLTGTLELEDTL